MSVPSPRLTINYFQSRENYFWRWAEQGEVIEWRNGTTICYRSLLQEILPDLKENLPPLGALLLVLATGRNVSGERTRLQDFTRDLRPTTQSETFVNKLKGTIALLNMLGSLPPKWWSGQHRTLLLQTLFAAAPSLLKSETAEEIINTFRSGMLDKKILEPVIFSQSILDSDLECLASIHDAFPNIDTLLLKLKTGIDSALHPLPLEIPEALPEDLLTALSADPESAGFTHLAKQMIAALHIPMHVKGSSDQLFGGVSDITNRGNFDRLLLSELAHDDLSLMVRLANNEALYLRREQIPADYHPERFLLVDTSIRMWGTPRILAMAAALACSLQNKDGYLPAYALMGDEYQPIQLGSKKGVLRALQLLSPALHSAKALSLFAKDHLHKQRQEYFLVTDEQLFHAAPFQEAFAAIRKGNGFLILVNREGMLQFFHYNNGHRHLVNSARYDLATILADQKPIPNAIGSPAFIQQPTPPLFFPFSRMLLNYFYYVVPSLGAIVIAEDYRLMYWPSVSRGGAEIMNAFPKAPDYYFGHDSRGLFFILFYKDGQLELFKLNIHGLTYTRHTFPIRLEGRVMVIFEKNNFLIKDGKGNYVLSHESNALKQEVHPLSFDHEAYSRQAHLPQVKKIINNGYNMYRHVKRIAVNNANRLSVNQLELRIQNNNIVWDTWTTSNNIAPMENTEECLIPGTQIKMTRFDLGYNAEAWMDSRGILHLRCNKAGIQEISIAMIHNKPTACWAADGTCCGSGYFTGDNRKVLPVAKFYEMYIQPVIDFLK